MKRDPGKGTSDFTGQEPSPAGVFVDPAVAANMSPTASAYLAGASARRLPKAQMPLAGGEAPAMPFLGTSGPPEGPPRSMAQHAAEQRRPAPGTVFTPAAGSIIQPSLPPDAAPAAPRAVNPHSLGLRPADTLPPEARNDPAFIEGQGSMVAASQPHLAAKYGVVRGGQIIPPQRLQQQSTGGQAQLRPETAQGLEALAAAQRAAESAAVPKEPLPSAVEPPSSAADVRKLRQEVGREDKFELNEFREILETNTFNTPEQRTLIEARLVPLDVGDLLLNNYAEQTIPIVPKKFEAVLRSYDGVTELALKRLTMQDSRSLDASEQYILDRYSFYGLAAMLHQVNDRVFPGYLTPEGAFDDAAFMARFNQVMKMPISMLSSLMVNAIWFDQRVRALFKVETLGNG